MFLFLIGVLLKALKGGRENTGIEEKSKQITVDERAQLQVEGSRNCRRK